MPRYVRYLRGAFTATCALACLLLLALWGRSYSWRDNLYLQLTPSLAAEFASDEGRCALLITERTGRLSIAIDSWRNEPMRGRKFYPFNSPQPEPLGFDAVWFGPTEWCLFAPHWFLLLITAALAVAPWLRCSTRFSLRTLLIIVTLPSIVLGTILYLIR